MSDVIGPIRRANPVLARCTNDPIVCNWSGWVWCPNPFWHIQCPICHKKIELFA